MNDQMNMARIYETMLSVPGMNELVKLNLSLSRKQIFFLHRVIERGVGIDAADVLEIPDGVADELTAFADDLLGRAGLKEMNEKLKGL